MSANTNQIIEILKELSKIDAKLAINNEKIKELNASLQLKSKTLKQYEEGLKLKLIELNDKQTRYQREEKFLKDEANKLVERRKSLTQLNNYKVQQAAEREIEASARQISAQEDTLVGMLDDIEKISDDVKKLEETYKSKDKEYQDTKSKADSEINDMSVNDSDYKGKREELIKQLDARTLQTYQRLQTRYPANSVVALQGTTCGGCHLDLGPQILSIIGKAETITTCRACARIIHL